MRNDIKTITHKHLNIITQARKNKRADYVQLMLLGIFTESTED